MYFRFPLLLILIFIGVIGLMILQSQFAKQIPTVNGEPLKETSDKPVFAEDAMNGIRAVDLRAHLEFLADDLLEGRDTGSRGARLAAMYIATHFERLALLPVGDNNSYYQSVELTQKRVLPNSELKVEIDGEMIPLKYKEDYLVVKTPLAPKTELTCNLVFTGFGIRAPEYDYNDFKDLDVQDRVVVYVSGEPYSDDENFFKGHARTNYASGITKRRIAEEAGASGSIGIIREDLLEQMNWSGLQNFFANSRIILKSADDETSNVSFPAIILHPDAADLIFAGTTTSFSEIDKDASKGTVQPFEMNKKVFMKFLFEEKDIDEHNVVGFLEGSDPLLKSEVIVFTAHYDHVGIGTAVEGDSIYNGAADNASGVSGLLELADAFASLPVAPRRSLLFLAVTAEEKGLLGSRYYVEHPIFPLEKTVANFNLDMIGIGDTTALVVYGIERSSLGEDIKKAAEQFQLKIYPDDMPEQRLFYRSDHYNFAQKGIPAIFPSFGIQRSDFQQFTKFYHRPSDDINLSWLNYNYMKKHVQVVFQAALWVANADAAPEWTPGDEFEKLGKKE